MQQLFAIISLTWKAAFRYRLFWVIALLLVGAVVGLPMLVKDDGTAEGFAQILITYTLGAVSGLLGMCTLWLACGTLARDVEECQIQMVVVKPIARWQIWLGKWLGIVTLNAALLGLAGACVFGLLEWRAQKLPPLEREKLMDEVLVARASAHENSMDAVIDSETDRIMQEQIKKGKMEGVDLDSARKQLREQVKSTYQAVGPDQIRPWVIHLGSAKDKLKDQALSLRVKFNTAQVGGLDTTYYAVWQIGTPPEVSPHQTKIMSLAPDTFHEFLIPPNLYDSKGDLTILFRNLNDVALLFPLEDGLEVLYPQGSFGANFVRGLGIILCWMALLAAVGLAAASFLSFPVAAFSPLALLVISFSSGTLANAVQEGTIMNYNQETGKKGYSPVDDVVMPVFRGMLDVINLVRGFSPIDSLSTGRSITWAELGQAVAQIVLLLGGILAAFGIFVFTRRELATAQGNQ